MSIEELIREELTVALSTVPAGTPAATDRVQQRGRRRLLMARVGMAAAGVAVFGGILAISLVVGRADGTPVGQSDTPARSVLIAGERFPVDGIVEAFSSVPLYYGAKAPAPRFDTSGFGDEWRLEFGRAKVADPDALDPPTVYLGEYNDESMFLNEQGYYDTPIKCLWIGPTPQICGDAGVFELLVPTRPGPPLGAWLGVPDGTSVVVLSRRDITLTETDESLGWESPVGGVALMPLPDTRAYVMTALDEDGSELGTVVISLTPSAPSPSSGPDDATTTTTTTPRGP